jgi:DNA polymerase-3 subunit gamma/tau
LEDPPNHAYFILCTTEPNKLLKGIRQRCLSIKLNPINDDALSSLLSTTCKKEEITLSKSVQTSIIEHAAGSGRQALQILDSIYQLEDKKEQLEAIEKSSVQTAVITIARKLLNKNTKWRDIKPILKSLVDEDPEQIRYMVLGYARSVLLSKDDPRAFRMLDAFADNFYDSKFAGVVAACYEIIQG